MQGSKAIGCMIAKERRKEGTLESVCIDADTKDGVGRQMKSKNKDMLWVNVARGFRSMGQRKRRGVLVGTSQRIKSLLLARCGKQVFWNSMWIMWVLRGAILDVVRRRTLRGWYVRRQASKFLLHIDAGGGLE